MAIIILSKPVQQDLISFCRFLFSDTDVLQIKTRQVHLSYVTPPLAGGVTWMYHLAADFLVWMRVGVQRNRRDIIRESQETD